jgi:branched-chain amino acid aminotransferase
MTPIANGTFLAGITRSRVIGLLRESGFDVREVTLTVKDFETADEIFTSGNYSKIAPVTKFEERSLQEGPVARKALELYMDWARSGGRNDA